MLARLPDLVEPPPKLTEDFYRSTSWIALVAQLKLERGARCEDCGRGGRVIGDHIIERKDGGAELDPSNIRLRCIPCHNRKTARVKARRARG